MNICKICQLSSPSGCTKLSNEVCLKDAPKLIRASTTNGDVIKAMFPKAEVIMKRAVVMVGISRMIVFDLDWWNASYKVGDTDEK